MELVCNSLGNVPRQLSEINYVVQGMNDKDLSISNIKDKLLYILKEYEEKAFDTFTRQNAIYLNTLKGVNLSTHLEALVQQFTFKPAFLSPGFLDLSLMYYNANMRLCRPITPMAGAALITNLQNHFDLLKDSDTIRILNPNTGNQEKSKAFERILIKAILFSQTNTFKSTNLKNDDLQEEEIGCNQAVPILSPAVLPTFIPTRGATLVFPLNDQYPIADLIFVDESKKKVILIQITTGHASAKVPHTTNAYPAVYQPQKWSQIVKDNFKSHSQPKSNYAEELLSLVGWNGTVTIDATTKQLILTNGNEAASLEYLIITPRQPDSTAANSYGAYPWIRVLHSEYLAKFLTPTIVDALCKSTSK